MNNSPGALRVVKVGGSLLDDPRLGRSLPRWLELQPPARNVLLVGGGPLVDAIRQADQRHQLGQQLCHWLSLRAMRITVRMVQTLLPGCPLLEDLTEIAHFHGPAAIFDPWRLLNNERESGTPLRGVHRRGATSHNTVHRRGATSHHIRLPESWDVTSDSIAAHVAGKLSADELVLLKSTGSPHRGIQQAAEAGVVDAHFPTAARGLRVRIVNLRNPNFDELLATAD